MTASVQTFPQKFTNWACQPLLSQAPTASWAARLSLIDTYACMIAGAGQRQSAVAVRALEDSGDAGGVIPAGGGMGRSLYGAALINGARAHALDFDDYEIPGSTHVSAPIFSALLALAQRFQVSIGEVCDAWVVGYEAIVRVGLALGYGHYEKGWHATATLGPIGVAAACSRLLRHTPERAAHAMALATSSSAGMKAQFGFDAKALHAGLAAEAGLRAAMLAKAGATGNVDIWDAHQGLMNMYGTATSMGFEAVVDTMREGEATLEFPVARKFWPCCSYSHRVIACSRVLAPQIKADETIDRIIIRMPEPFHRVSGFLAPSTSNEARFSAVYCTVTGLLTGQVEPADFTEARFLDPERQRLCALVELDLYPLPLVPPDQLMAVTPEKVRVKLSSGRWIEHETSATPGGDEQPMTDDDVLAKLISCGGRLEVGRALLNMPLHEMLNVQMLEE